MVTTKKTTKKIIKYKMKPCLFCKGKNLEFDICDDKSLTWIGCNDCFASSPVVEKRPFQDLSEVRAKLCKIWNNEPKR
jgi:hypothetical protein